MDRTLDFTPTNDLEPTNTSTTAYQSRTSFLIEDILYRRKREEDLEKTYENNLENNRHRLKYDEKTFQLPRNTDKRTEKTAYSYFQPGIIQNGLSSCMQSFQAPDNNGYIQVMGALGAYLQTPYKNVSDPYFLSQGIHVMYINYYMFSGHSSHVFLQELPRISCNISDFPISL